MADAGVPVHVLRKITGHADLSTTQRYLHPDRQSVAGASCSRRACGAASRSKRTYFSPKYKRIASHRGPMKALVAVEHSMLVAAWNMLTNGEFYRDPGPDYYTRRVRAKTKTRAIRQLESLGYRVTLEPITHTA
jgi:hypothetical protein